MLSIVIAPDPVLSKNADKVEKVNKDVLRLIEEMKQTLLSRIFITKLTEKSPIGVFINPEIIQIDTDNNQRISADNQRKSPPTKLEGCLSLPSIWGTVFRSPKIKLEYLDENGKTHSKIFTEFMATIMQHEIDHLDGILFPKRVLEQGGTLYKSHKNKKGQDEFDEIEI
ncbi:MAG: peptide deformylase [Candidatus Levybacteria bacterium]|nr:peptide deformylase [Candidatus Levybacteria bacterium]